VRNANETCRGCLVAAAVAGLVLTWADASASIIEPKKVLFIGNSYTYNAVGYDGIGQQLPPYGTTPGTDGTWSDRFFLDTNTSAFEALVAAASGSTSFLNFSGSQNIAVPGRSLDQHNGLVPSDRPTILHQDNFAILNQQWDIIIVQEFSTRPARTVYGTSNYNAAETTGFYTNGLGKLADEIIAKNQQADILLFNTWAREPGTYPNSGFANYQTMRDLLDQGYATAAEYLTASTATPVVKTGAATFLNGKGLTNNVSLAMVGQAFDFALHDSYYALNLAPIFGDIERVLYETDASHQNLGGEFLTASVLFELIYGKSVLHMIDVGILTQDHLLGLHGPDNSNINGISGSSQNLDLQLARYLAGVSMQITGVPEPGTVVLLLAGAGMLASRRRRAA
jgi:hypothetical protein